MTFDAEVVVRVEREPAVARVGFEDALRHGDAGGDSVALHVFDGDALVAVDILLERLARGALLGRKGCSRKEDDERKYCFSGNIHYLC